MLSKSEENYLKAMFHLSAQYSKGISTNAIAKQLETKASSVTDMVKKLADKELVLYKKYQGVTLTKQGEKIAVNIIRKHRLWEVLLVEKLNFNWDEVHEVAEQLEHIQSEKLIDELDEFLGFPKRDPHGDPIPDKDGNINFQEKVLLSTLNSEASAICVGVKDTSSEFLKYLDKQGIALGKEMKVLEKEKFDNSMRIEMEEKEYVISFQIANNIYVKNL
ncbi:metal-dependent transcriptional regulator [Pseudofulvibacter geojedonensis]|uniref:Transcriptional regulator MntR n=1 Tax=Pseudofulvibacter geojedonensis TaxID=1123758 RepID=A0ABW3I3X3_9FLAO